MNHDYSNRLNEHHLIHDLIQSKLPQKFPMKLSLLFGHSPQIVGIVFTLVNYDPCINAGFSKVLSDGLALQPKLTVKLTLI